MMTSYRADQVGEQVREEIMSIIRRDLKDPRIGFVSITAVRMSPDLRQARVRVSVLGDPEEKKASIKGLVSAKGLIRHELGRRLRNLKFSPGVATSYPPEAATGDSRPRALFRLLWRSAVRASLMALSAVAKTTALSRGLTVWMCSRWARTTSTEDTFLSRMARASQAAGAPMTSRIAGRLDAPSRV